MIKALALLVAAGLAPGAAFALEKCVGPDGKISYMDRCPSDSTRAPAKTDEQLVPKLHQAPVIIKPELPPLPEVMKPVAPPVQEPAPKPAATAPAASPAPAIQAPPADVKVEYYDVQGADQAALVQALNARGTGHAKSSWKLSYQYQPRREKGMCGVGVVVTQLELAMILPRWSPPPGTPPDLIERWEKYVNALMALENGRLEKARELDRALKPALQGLPLAADCNALDAAVTERYEALQQQSRRDAESVQAKSPIFE